MDKDIFMLCESITESELRGLKGEYQANIKFDGERIIAVVKDNEVFLLNRRGVLKNRQFREVEEELKVLPNCVIDGEVISQDGDFSRTQSRAGTQNKYKIAELEKQIPIYFMVFDILSLGTNDLRNKPLKERLEELKQLFSIHYVGMENVRLCDYVPIEMALKEAKDKQLEGVVIKDMNGVYESKRSKNWLKLKLWKEDCIKIVKYEENNKGIRAETSDGVAVQIAGSQSKEVRSLIDKQGLAEIYIQYLEKTENDMFRFISYRGLK